MMFEMKREERNMGNEYVRKKGQKRNEELEDKSEVNINKSD